MTIGPVQLIVLGFGHADFHGEVTAELERLRECETVRVIDSIAVYKDACGGLEVEHLSNLSQREAIGLGTKIGELIGLGIEGEGDLAGGVAPGADQAGACEVPAPGGWDVLADIPNGSAAALILVEHHWAAPLRDTVARAGGARISDGFIGPLDLAAVGLLPVAEAKHLHALASLRTAVTAPGAAAGR